MRCVLVVAVLLLFAPRVHAFERQWHAGVDVGYAGLSWNDTVHSGFGGGLHLAYGLTDSYNLMVEVGGSTHSVCSGCSSLFAGHAAAGVGYTLDVISWVPYAGLLVGGYRFSGADLESAQAKLGFQAALGLDFRPNRSCAVGVQLRYHTFAADPFQTHYVTTFARFELTWGW
jgi:opacity protein-like surface antigen